MPPAVAIAAFELSRPLEAGRASLEAALARGLAAAGLQVVDAATARARGAAVPELAGCKEEACLPGLAELLGAPHLVYGEVVSTRRLYAVGLRVRDAADGRTLASAAVECRASDPCPPIPNSLEQLARELGASARAEIALVERQRQRAGATKVRAAARLSPQGTPATPFPIDTAAASPSRGRAPTPVPTDAARAPLGPVARPPALTDDGGSRSALSDAAPWALVGAGGALLAGSGVLFARDGGGTDCLARQSGGRVCVERRETTAAAIAVGAAGLAATGAGIGWWLFDRQAAEAPAGAALSEDRKETRGAALIELTFGPGSVGLRGTF